MVGGPHAVCEMISTDDEYGYCFSVGVYRSLSVCIAFSGNYRPKDVNPVVVVEVTVLDVVVAFVGLHEWVVVQEEPGLVVIDVGGQGNGAPN